MQFDFGKNWSEFSWAVLNQEKILQASKDFITLFREIELRDRSFLDVGFGQGLSLLVAAEQGARTVGCDINPKCREVIERNRASFQLAEGRKIDIVVGSILDDNILNELRVVSPDGTGQYDIVHSWGVLHHTGNMKEALKNVCSLVKPEGQLVIAIYNKHWTSPAWHIIKYAYNRFSLLQKPLIALLYPVIYLAKFAVTGKNPKKQERGMDFYFDVVDWVGGYPYEYASIPEIEQTINAEGFVTVKTVKACMPTGCNEFIFAKT